MNEPRRQQVRERLEQSQIFQWMERVQRYLDDYYLDAVAGFLPWGIGDIGSALFSLVYIWFAATRIKSLPLVLALLNNTLRDIMLGLIPFYVGDVIDFFHRANHQNMALIRGFVDGDATIIATVRKKAWISALFILLSVLLIAILVWIAIEITSRILQFIF